MHHESEIMIKTVQNTAVAYATTLVTKVSEAPASPSLIDREDDVRIASTAAAAAITICRADPNRTFRRSSGVGVGLWSPMVIAASSS